MSFSPTYDLFVFAAVGTIFLWMRLRYRGGFFDNLEDLIDQILDDFRFRTIIHLITFVVAGCFVSVYFIEPNTKKQAFTAGAGFTVLVGDLVKVGAGRKKKT